MSDSTDTEDSTADQAPTHLANTIPDDTAAVEVSGTTSNSDTGTKDAPEVAEMAPEDGSSTRLTAPVTHVDITQSPRASNLRNIQKLEESFSLGYDSDGELGPFTNMEEVEGEQIFEELEMDERNDSTT